MTRRVANPVPGGPPPGGPDSATVRIGSQIAVAGQCGYRPDRSLVEVSALAVTPDAVTPDA